MKDNTFDLIVWVGGITMFTVGCGYQWGWPASLVALGSVLTFWPLVKQFK